MMVDGLENSVYEVNTVADAPGPDNPHHNAFHAEATLLRSEGTRPPRHRPARRPLLEDRQPIGRGIDWVSRSPTS